MSASIVKASASALAAFARFLVEQDVNEDYVHTCIDVDSTCVHLVMALDRFGLYLVCTTGSDGKQFAMNYVVSYFRGVKVWLIDKHPVQRVYAENAVVGKTSLLQRACKKRVNGGYVHSHPPCTKVDLEALLECLYASARSEKDYQDVALVCLMWLCFGRASDMAHMRKEHAVLPADGTLFVRLLRVKTAQEQGFALAPDKNGFAVCPNFAMAAALATQGVASTAFLAQLPALVTLAAVAADDAAPLFQLLELDVDVLCVV